MKEILSSGRILGISLLLFVVLEGFMSFVIWQRFEEKKAFILERNVKIFEDVYVSTRLAYQKVTKLLFDEVVNTPEVIAIFKEAADADPEVQALVRRNLYEKLRPTYERMQSINLRQLHFHLPDSSSFLRFHRPERFGDSLQGIRYSIDLANREKRYVEGFEEGRIYNGFRYVYPLFDAYGTHLGSVEISLSCQALQHDMERVIKDHIDFVVKRDLVNAKVWKDEQNNYYPSLISPAYVHEALPDDGKGLPGGHDAVTLEITQEASPRMDAGERFALYESGYIVTFLPIANVAGDGGAAYLIGYDKNNAIPQLKEDAFVMWCFGLLTALLSAVLAYLLMQKMAEIKEMATFDMLTRLLNRNSLTERLEDEIARMERSGDPFSVIFLDIDDFKIINDRYGHAAGDRALKSIAELLVGNVRRTDAVGRWGGEEFLICLSRTSSEEALAVAEKLRHAVDSYDFELPVELTCSFGVTAYRPEEGLDALVSRADHLLYQAKMGGKNRVAIQE